MIEEINILRHHGWQFIPDLLNATIPPPFRGRPVISKNTIDEEALSAICPTNAITIKPVCIDLTKCIFCGECAIRFPEKVTFTNDHKMATNDTLRMQITTDSPDFIKLNPALIRPEIEHVFGRSLKLRQISAGGDNSAELELAACGNPNFDMGRYGIEFVSSPRHADGIVITGPITKNMAEALRVCYDAVPKPRLVILCGTDALSGGIFAESAALNRSFLEEVVVDLYVPGNPPHPLTFIHGILELTRTKMRRK